LVNYSLKKLEVRLISLLTAKGITDYEGFLSFRREMPS